VAKGGEAILTHTFLNNFPGANYHKIQLLQNNDIECRYFNLIAQQYDAVSRLIKITLDPQKEIQVSIGGDHSISFYAIGSILERNNPNDVGIIMFDSHADLYSKNTSPSGNFHGMWAYPLLNQFDVDIIDQKILHKIPSQNWLHIGDLEGEPCFGKQELDLVKEKQITHLSKQLLSEKINKAKNILDKFLNDHKHIYITFDIDVYTKDIAPATGLTGDWGLDNNAIPIFLETIAKSNKLIGADVTEVNPEKDGADKTVAVAQEVLLKLLS